MRNFNFILLMLISLCCYSQNSFQRIKTENGIKKVESNGQMFSLDNKIVTVILFNHKKCGIYNRFK